MRDGSRHSRYAFASHIFSSQESYHEFDGCLLFVSVLDQSFLQLAAKSL